MTKTIATISITKPFSIFLTMTFIAAALAVGIPADAATDNIATCDRLAAHPDDRDKPTDSAGPKDEKAAIAFYKKAADLGSDEAADAQQRLRCKFTLTDKNGKAVGSICYTGD